MAEEQGRSGGKSYGNHRSYGSGRSGGSRNGSGRSFGGSRGGFHKGGKSDGFRRDGGFRRDREGSGEGREFKRDGERRDFHDGERRDFRRNDGERGGFRRDGEHRQDGDNPRYQRDGEHRGFRRGGDDRRDFRRDGDRRDFKSRDGEHRGFRRDGERDDRNARRDGDRRQGGNPRFQRDGEHKSFHRDGERRDFHRDNDRKDFKRDDRRNDRADNERREFTADEKRAYRETKRREYMDRGPRRNSDGTMSFPSQNPYTARRPDEPKMPKGMEWSMLSADERDRLRGLSKEHAENIGLHILAAYALEESDPKAALEHAKWVARQASRIDFSRETLAFVAYRQGDYKLALREFRTAYRMNGFLDYLPFIADCERGTGNPKKAIEVAVGDDAKQLRGESKAEMFLVYAGALSDLGQNDKAIEIVHTLGRSKGLPGEYRMRAIQAEQYFLEEAGRGEEAADLDPLLDKLELQYADDDDAVNDAVIDHDLERFSDDELDMLGISEDDAQYAPDDDEDESASDDGASDGASDNASSDEDSDDAESVEEIAGMSETAGHEAEAPSQEPDNDESELPAREAQDGVDAENEPATDIDDAATADDAVDAASDDAASDDAANAA